MAQTGLLLLPLQAMPNQTLSIIPDLSAGVQPAEAFIGTHIVRLLHPPIHHSY
jgi:hypothetical protein